MDTEIVCYNKPSYKQIILCKCNKYGVGEDSCESLGQQGDPTDFLINEISPEYPEYSLEGLKLKLKLQYFGHLIRRSD